MEIKKTENTINSDSSQNANICLSIKDLAELIGTEVSKAVQTTTINLLTRSDFDQMKVSANKFTELQNSKEQLSICSSCGAETADGSSFGEIDDSGLKENLRLENLENAQDPFEMQKLKSECEQLKSTLDKFKAIIERSSLETQILRSEVSSMNDNYNQTMNELQIKTDVLQNENQQLKLKMEEKTAQINSMQEGIEKMKKYQLEKHQEDNVDCIKRQELEDKIAQIVTENLLKFQEMQNGTIVEIEALNVKLKIAEELINLTRADYQKDRNKIQEESPVDSIDKKDFKARFSYTIKQFDELGTSNQIDQTSPPIIYGKLRWEINVKQVLNLLQFKLKCNDINGSQQWSSCESGEFRLKSSILELRKRFYRIFSDSNNYITFSIDRVSLFNLKNGILQSDGSITLEMNMFPDVSNGFPSGMNHHTEGIMSYPSGFYM